MSFLAPFFLIGAAAVALPVLFHLIRRTTREETPFSSLMFLLPTPPRVTRRSRLDNILLLILRCLVVGLLALGFARPFLKKPMAAAPEVTGSAKVIVLVDASASMKRENLWSEALDRAEVVLKKLQPGDGAAVLVFDQQVRSLTSFAQWTSMNSGERVGMVLQKLKETTPSWASTALGNALITAADAFEDSDKKEHATGPRRIVLITDLQEGSKLEGLQGFEWTRGVEVAVEVVKVKKPTNAAIQLLGGAEESSADSAASGARVRISNSTDAGREQFQVRWANGSGGSEVYVPPGQNRTLPLPETTAGSGDRLVLAGDDAEFDNSLHIIPAQTNEVRVLFLGPDAENDPTQALYYVKRAFQDTRRQTVKMIAKSPGAVLSAEDALGVELMIISDALPDSRIAVVKEWLNEGRTALLALRTPAAAATLGGLAGVASVAAEEARITGYAMLGQIDFQHPLFAPFADPRFSDFTKIHFWKHRRLSAAQFPGAQVLARFDGPEADPAMMQVRVGKGNLLAFTFGWFPSDSQFALSSKFVPLLYAMLEQSGAIKTQTSQYAVGDSVDLAALRSPDELRLRKPDGTEVKVAPGQRFTQTEAPGLYAVESVQPSFRFAVNLAPEESRTAPLPQETLERLGVPVKTQVAPTPKQIQRAAQAREHLMAAELEGRQKLWRWLIVAALVVLMGETWLAGRLTRRAASQTEALT